MKIALASDHAGFELKKDIAAYLANLGHTIIDLGATTLDPQDDYTNFIIQAASQVAYGKADRAVVIGGSGTGEAIGANRFPGVRAVVVNIEHPTTLDIVKLSREHNDANVISFGARFVSAQFTHTVLDMWLSTNFSNAERHSRRNNALDSIE